MVVLALEGAAPALDEVRTAEAHLAIEQRDGLRLVLQVGVDGAHVAATRALEAAAPAGGDAEVGRMMHPDHARMARGQRFDLRRGAVAAAVVHQHQLAPDAAALEDALRALDQLGKIALLVVARDDDAQLDGGGPPGHGEAPSTGSAPAATRASGARVR